MREIVFALTGLFVLVIFTNVALYVFTWQQARLLKDLNQRIEKLED